ncbi:MAG: 30S ribosomal protein S24e [Caldisphaera sp.]|jgi:small subunit ribosomal protein S24e|nr:30S ribosomal protein S24e [Caldisphaera sp.]
MPTKRIDIDKDVWIEIIEEKENKIFERKEINGIIHHELKSTPSRISIRRKVANAYNKDLSTVFVKSIRTNYGQGMSNVHIHIYYLPEHAKKYETQYIVDRNGGFTLEESQENKEGNR